MQPRTRVPPFWLSLLITDFCTEGQLESEMRKMWDVVQNMPIFKSFLPDDMMKRISDLFDELIIRGGSPARVFALSMILLFEPLLSGVVRHEQGALPVVAQRLLKDILKAYVYGHPGYHYSEHVIQQASIIAFLYVEKNFSGKGINIHPRSTLIHFEPYDPPEDLDRDEAMRVQHYMQLAIRHSYKTKAEFIKIDERRKKNNKMYFVLCLLYRCVLDGRWETLS